MSERYDKLGSTGPQLIKSFGHSYTTITYSISDLIQVLLWNDIDSCFKWSSLTYLWEMTLKIPWKEERREKGVRLCQKRHLAVHVPIARLHALSGGGGWGCHTMNTPGQSAKWSHTGSYQTPLQNGKTESHSTPPSGRPCVSLKGEQASPAPAQILPNFPTN